MVDGKHWTQNGTIKGTKILRGQSGVRTEKVPSQCTRPVDVRSDD